MSLREILHNEIKDKGELTIAEVYAICTEQHKKQSNAERRLREMKDIEPIRKKNYICGYRFRGHLAQDLLF